MDGQVTLRVLVDRASLELFVNYGKAAASFVVVPDAANRTIAIEGEACYRELMYESGGHRVQRVPDTETKGRVHTSAATVAVLPEPEDVEIDLKPEDINIERYAASSGPGGQHVNKTSSAIRITHHDTGQFPSSYKSCEISRKQRPKDPTR